MKKGIVYLVGAGPGDPGLLTLRGKSVLEKADVIIYDRLVNSQILLYAGRAAERIYGGKLPGEHSLSQEEINKLLVKKARQGKTVVRLKGGDPFLFGRGGEEALYLAGHGCDFAIVPGITSAIAAPAYAGIPVTHRDMASSFAVITGHEKPGKQASAVHWQEIARGVDTLVFLMGVENLGVIVSQLIAQGKKPSTPAALICSGTLPAQKVLTGTLRTIVKKAARADLKPPAVLVVGEVVRLKEKLFRADKKPLAGKKVLITRPAAQAASFAEKIVEIGGEPVVFPTVEIVTEPDLRLLHQALGKIESYDRIIFTSLNAVDIFFAELAARQVDIRSLQGARLCAIGPETRERLRLRGLFTDIMPRQFCAEGILQALQGKLQPGQKVLLPRARNARPVLPEGLRRQGVSVDEIYLYRASVPKTPDTSIVAQIMKGTIDIITFTSSSTVSNFVKLLGKNNISRLPRKIMIACIGPITAATARKNRLRVALEAKDYTTDGLIAAILKK
jgi:uroporphyrinogen III methyltransferase/synthase